MRIQLQFLIILACLWAGNVHAQTYSLLIKGGHVIDPKNGINGVMDVAINADTIAKVAKSIPEKQARQIVQAKGMYVTPGLIDIHTHNFFGTEKGRYLSNSFDALPPDGFTFRVGVTTIVDAGCAGWKTFPTFKDQTIDHSQTRVLALLNIVGEGMRGGAYEQNTQDMDAKMTASVARQYRQYVVGVKVAHYIGAEWTPVDRAVEAGKIANIPVMVDFGSSTPPLPIEELFMKHLRPGDIFTHCFARLGSREPIVDLTTNQVKPFVWEAQKKGIIFDVGYGGISFSYAQSIPALKSGFFPNTISTDIHTASMNHSMKDMLNVMSKFLNMGMDLPSVIKASTWASAQAIKREELGHLSQGAVADVAVFSMREGDFGFFDYTGYKINGKYKMECELTVRAGKVVYDLNGIAVQAESGSGQSTTKH
ncbi:amidohydrolase/deacetylase family metallohydrolase [Xanthocytophaga flava]|uniref:amidohydrolase/deacetylase family metallohydrolase n=1 Tax=Xanthocytophaga flava TaxID=3048013 RepID=UPI0028D6927D|nr:amidohydrolase/deacetylase family metallohydrolase [Xanthocytophaga flavus]MDJ1466626.1 amidohydrolase/deacetylase family metallohydrolase [Xanthocytophaga flavus]